MYNSLLPEIYRKPFDLGHLAIKEKSVGPNGVRYRGVPLYKDNDGQLPLRIFSFDFKPGNSIPTEFFTEIADAQADNLETLVGRYIQEQTGD